MSRCSALFRSARGTTFCHGTLANLQQPNKDDARYHYLKLVVVVVVAVVVAALTYSFVILVVADDSIIPAVVFR